MMAVKLIRVPAKNLEGEINAFLQGLGSVPGYYAELRDIKLLHIGGKDDLEEALIIYNRWAAKGQPAPKQQTKR